MLVIPRIEIVDGAVVTQKAGWGVADPISAARTLADAGFTRLHVADRDALEGRGLNASAVESITRDGTAEVQVASGSDSVEQIETWIDAGASRVVVGPRALSETDWLATAAEAYAGALILETSVHERRVVTRGWVRTLPVDLLDLVDEIAGLPLAALLIAPRGGDSGAAVELALLEDVVDASTVPVLLEDCHPSMRGLYAVEQRGLAGVVVPADAFHALIDPRSVANEFGR